MFFISCDTPFIFLISLHDAARTYCPSLEMNKLHFSPPLILSNDNDKYSESLWMLWGHVVLDFCVSAHKSFVELPESKVSKSIDQFMLFLD